jgi:hypothetical protein
VQLHIGGKMTMKQVADRLLEKLMSRKLMVWLTATGLLAYSDLTSSDWVAISLVYIGTEGLADIASRWKHGR